MYEFIKGKLVSITPTYAVLDNSGIGYFINISLNTYSQIQEMTECKLFIHQVIREDANILYGFHILYEREIFRHLISVSGIGSNTARMILSSMRPNEVTEAIITGNVNLLKGIKGIGIKTAQRIIIDLKDKVGKSIEGDEFFISPDNTIKEEALSALVMLGFAKNAVYKVLEKILVKEPDLNVEELIKKALKQL